MKPDLNLIKTGNDFTRLTNETREHSAQPSCDNAFMLEIIASLKNAKTAKEATRILFDEAQNGNFEVINGVLFKHEDYAIQNMLTMYGQKHADNLKKLSELQLSIVPEYIDSFTKEHEIFIITKVPGAKTGKLSPFNKEYDKISTESLRQAFKDFQKLTKAGLVDAGIANSTRNWFVTPDDNKVMLPVWRNLQPIQDSERTATLEEYYQKLFRQ